MDLWKRLKEEKRPILMYGMGLGGDKILKYCAEKGIEVEGFFASDGFVRGHSFHGKRVMSYSEAKEKYGDFVVLLSFASSIPSVMGQILKIAGERGIYAPDVPVTGDELFDDDFYEANREKFTLAREAFADERSKELFDDMVSFKLTGELKYLFHDLSCPDEVFSELLFPHRYRVCVDLGAYVGDTVKELRKYCKNVEKIISFEPDPKNFKKLEKYTLENCPELCEIYNCAASEKDEIRCFSTESSRNSALLSGHISNVGARITEINCRSVDSICLGRRVDYIKYDVEGAEEEALLGAAETIKESRPDMLISAYHRSSDLFTLPLLLKKLNPNYKLYLRRFPYIPAWDLNIYAIDPK